MGSIRSHGPSHGVCLGIHEAISWDPMGLLTTDEKSHRISHGFILTPVECPTGPVGFPMGSVQHVSRASHGTYGSSHGKSHGASHGLCHLPRSPMRFPVGCTEPPMGLTTGFPIGLLMECDRPHGIAEGNCVIPWGVPWDAPWNP